MVVVGAQGSGKTSLINRYMKKDFNPKVKQTTGAIEKSFKIDLQQTNSKIELWTFDLPGMDSLMGLNRMYLRDANIALVVYDVTNKESMTKAETWIEELKSTGPSEMLICICGNKMEDGKRKISLADGQTFAKSQQCSVFSEVSAKTKENMDQFFIRLASEAYAKRNTFTKVERSSV